MVELEVTALLDRGRPASALDRVVENVQRYETLGDDLGVLRMSALQGRTLVALGRNADAAALLAPLWEGTSESAENLRALALVAKHYGAAMLGLGEQQALATLLDRWVLIAEGLGGEADLAEALGSMGLVYWTRGAPFIGRQLLESSAELALANGLTMIAARALSNLAALAIANDLNQALEYGLAAREQCLKSGRAGYIQAQCDELRHRVVDGGSMGRAGDAARRDGRGTGSDQLCDRPRAADPAAGRARESR